MIMYKAKPRVTSLPLHGGTYFFSNLRGCAAYCTKLLSILKDGYDNYGLHRVLGHDLKINLHEAINDFLDKAGDLNDEPAALTLTEFKVLRWLSQRLEGPEYFGENFSFYSFKPIQRGLKLNRRQVCRACRSLKRQGLLTFSRGLFNDDSEVAGSGYACTAAGARYVLLYGIKHGATLRKKSKTIKRERTNDEE